MHPRTGMVKHRAVKTKWFSMNSLRVAYSGVKSIVMVRTFTSISFAPASCPSRAHIAYLALKLPWAFFPLTHCLLHSSFKSSFQLLLGLCFFYFIPFLLLNSPLSFSASFSQPSSWLTVALRSYSSLKMSPLRQTLEMDFVQKPDKQFYSNSSYREAPYRGPETNIYVFQQALWNQSNKKGWNLECKTWIDPCV